MKAGAVRQHRVDEYGSRQKITYGWGELVTTKKRTGHAVIYLRQSTSREESISMEIQEDACREYCRRRGYAVVTVCADPGVSGLQFAKRPGIRQALELVKSGAAEIMIVYRWSRLSRRQLHQAVILDTIESAGGRVESASEPIDTATAGGRFGRNVLLAAADFESAQKSEQWREAQARRVARGLMPGGAPPFGYVKAEKRGEPPSPDPQTGPVVRQMYADYLKGHGLQRLAHDLNSAGIRSTRGKPLSIMTVARILDSGFAAGYLNLGVNVRDQEGLKIPGVEHRERGAHEPLIDDATWQAYLKVREDRRKIHPKARQPKWHLGAGLAVCGRCGGNLVVNTYGDNSQAMCAAYKASRACDGVWMNRQMLDSLVGLWLGGRLSAWADQQDQLQGVDTERADLGRQVDAARADQAQLNEGRRAVNRQTARGVITEDEADAALAEVDAERASLDSRIGDLQARLDLLSPDADVWARLQRGSKDQTPSEWNVILKRVIERVAVTREEVTIKGWSSEPIARYDRADIPRKVRSTRPTRDSVGRFQHT
jgi:site-specific DNA recombinase